MPKTSHPAFSMAAKLELIRAACGLRLPAYESRTLIALASLLNDKTGCAYPSHALLAGLVNVDERNVRRALKGLQRRGLVSIAVPGTKRRATRYTVDAAAVQLAGAVSTDRSEGSPQTGQTRLYRQGRPVSTDRSEGSPQTGEGQRRASEAQAKQQLKLSASRFALRRRDEARSLDAPAPPAARPRTKNAWAATYRAPRAEAAD